MKLHHKPLFALVFCLLSGTLFCQSNLTTVVVGYIRSSDSGKDSDSIAALTWSVGSLNSSGGNAAGYMYVMAPSSFLNFQEAAAYKSKAIGQYGSDVQFEFVCHGIVTYSDGVRTYTGYVSASGDPVAENDAKETLGQPLSFCNEERLDNDIFAAGWAAKRGHKYRRTDGTIFNPGGTGGGSTATPPTTTSVPIYGQVLVGYWRVVSTVNGVVVDETITPVYENQIIGYRETEDPYSHNRLASTSSRPRFEGSKRTTVSPRARPLLAWITVVSV
jgi:hypothetical protein